MWPGFPLHEPVPVHDGPGYGARSPADGAPPSCTVFTLDTAQIPSPFRSPNIDTSRRHTELTVPEAIARMSFEPTRRHTYPFNTVPQTMV